MTRRVTWLRLSALLSAGTLALYELRYLAAYGRESEQALSEQGHAQAVVGGFVGDSIEVGHVESSFDAESFAAAAVGAIVMLAAFRVGGGRV